MTVRRLTSLTIVVFPLWVFVPLPKRGVLYVDLRRFAQMFLLLEYGLRSLVCVIRL